MGGEVLLLMERGETRKVRLFLETVCKRGEGGLWLKALNRSEKTGEE